MAVLGQIMMDTMDTLKKPDTRTISLPKSVQECLVHTSKALHQVELRRDIDSLYLHFEFLLHDSIRQQLYELLKRNDRTWRVELVFLSPILPPFMDESQLRTALSILQPVQYLSLRYVLVSSNNTEPLPLDKNIQRQVLQCLPNFHHWKCLDLQDWGDLDQQELQEDGDDDDDDIGIFQTIPGLPPFTRFSIALPQPPIQGNMIAPTIASQLRSIKIDFTTLDKTSFATVLAILQTLEKLPLLEDLHVMMPKATSSVVDMIPGFLSTWMETPRCLLTHLTIFLDRPHQLTFLLDVLPRMPLLQSFTINSYYHDDWNLLFDALLRAVANTPSIRHLGFEYECTLDRTVARRLLQFLLDSRPRLLSIWIHPEALIDEEFREAIALVSHINHALGLMQQYSSSLGEKPVPMSVWPLLLAKLRNSNADNVNNRSLTDAVQKKKPAPISGWSSWLPKLGYNTNPTVNAQLSDAGNMVSLDASFDMVKRFLPRHATDLAFALAHKSTNRPTISWKVSVVDVEYGYTNPPKELIATM